MLDPERCIIDPRIDDAEIVAEWVKYQGDGRGFELDDGTIIVFDSFGATHDSAARYLKVSNQIKSDFIIQRNGDVAALYVMEVRGVNIKKYYPRYEDFFHRMKYLISGSRVCIAISFD